MKRAIILSGLLVAMVSFAGVQNTYAGAKGTCVTKDASGAPVTEESTAKDCKAKGGEFTKAAKAGKAKKAK